MKELVEKIAKALVDNPDMVQVNEIAVEQSIIFELKVAPEDMGKVIGKQGSRKAVTKRRLLSVE